MTRHRSSKAKASSAPTLILASLLAIIATTAHAKAHSQVEESYAIFDLNPDEMTIFADNINFLFDAVVPTDDGGCENECDKNGECVAFLTQLQEGDLSYCMFLKYDDTEEGLNAVDPGPDYVSWRYNSPSNITCSSETNIILHPGGQCICDEETEEQNTKFGCSRKDPSLLLSSSFQSKQDMQADDDDDELEAADDDKSVESQEYKEDYWRTNDDEDEEVDVEEEEKVEESEPSADEQQQQQSKPQDEYADEQEAEEEAETKQEQKPNKPPKKKEKEKSQKAQAKEKTNEPAAPRPASAPSRLKYDNDGIWTTPEQRRKAYYVDTLPHYAGMRRRR